MFERYVAIGDSSTEGLIDPDGQGGYRGWADRLAEHIAAAQGSLQYANLAIRGRRTQRIRDEQLGTALAMRPDLATLFSGTNDLIRRGFDIEAVAADIEYMQHRLIAGGATVLTFTLPDLTPVMPIGRLVAARVQVMNATMRRVAGATGAILVDFAAHSVASDPRLWHEDRLHANSLGHESIAAALARALAFPISSSPWTDSLPPAAPTTFASRLADELRWIHRYLMPWVWRHLHGRSSGDGRQPKRPHLLPVEPGPAT